MRFTFLWVIMASVCRCRGWLRLHDFFAGTIGLTVQSAVPVHHRLTLSLGEDYNIREDEASYIEYCHLNPRNVSQKHRD